MNTEMLSDAAASDCTMICLNGALDKVRSGYYPALLFPNLAKSAERFYVDFEAAYYLRPLGGGAGWLYRVYPEPWQLARTTKEGPPALLPQTFEQRPSLADAVALLRSS